VLLSRLTMPVVTTFHTCWPSRRPRSARDGALVEASSKGRRDGQKARELLRSVYQVPDDKIEVIAHGIPDVAFVGPEAAKARLGFAGRRPLLTFGLLSPTRASKSYRRHAVDPEAPPRCGLCRARCDTFPIWFAEKGEAYRRA